MFIDFIILTAKTFAFLAGVILGLYFFVQLGAYIRATYGEVAIVAYAILAVSVIIAATFVVFET